MRGDREWAFDVCVFDGAHELWERRLVFQNRWRSAFSARRAMVSFKGPAVGAFQAVRQADSFPGFGDSRRRGVEYKNGAAVAADALATASAMAAASLVPKGRHR